MEHETETRSGFTERLKEDSKQRIESGRRSAADQVSEIAQAITRASEQLRDTQPTMADYAGRLAEGVGNLATRLREGSWEVLVEDTRQLARRNPALYLAGGVAVGFALSRFIKASGQRASQRASTGREYFSEPSGQEGAGFTAASQGAAQDVTSTQHSAAATSSMQPEGS